MGLLVDGQWQDKWYDTDSNNGKFKREAAQLVIGSQKMAALDLQEVVGLKRKQIATTYMLP